MNLQEMIELSILDAMGLLDDEERVAFEVAFRTSNPGVQAQVRREQTRLASIENFLPDVTPPAGLRAAVVEAVRREIATSNASSTNPALMVARSMVKPRAVSPLWRASAMALAAAALVFGITTVYFENLLTDFANKFHNDELLAAVDKEFGANFVNTVLFDRDTHRVVLTPAKSVKGEASLFVNSEKGEGQFFCRAIATPVGKTFKLAIIDPKTGEIVKELVTFTSNGSLTPVKVRLSPDEHGRIALVTTSGGPDFDTVLAGGDLPAPAI
jgi:anti-sigma-K factor RskA